MSQSRLILSAGGLLAAILLAVAAAIVAGYSVVAADQGAMLKFKPEQHDFGKVTATNDSAPLTVTVINKSRSAPITFTSIVAAETFSIQSDKCSGSPLAPGKSCKVEVVFHPMVTGKVSAPNGLTFTDSAPNSPQQVQLEGQGTVGSFFRRRCGRRDQWRGSSWPMSSLRPCAEPTTALCRRPAARGRSLSTRLSLRIPSTRTGTSSPAALTI